MYALLLLGISIGESSVTLDTSSALLSLVVSFLIGLIVGVLVSKD